MEMDPVPPTTTDCPADLPEDASTTYIPPRPSSGQDEDILNSEIRTISVWRINSEREVAMDIPGTTLRVTEKGDAQFELHRLIGSGGMGEVWEATQRSLSRNIAIKRAIATRDRSADEAYRQFREEAIIAARLEHPNILPVHDFGFDEHGRPLLAMKLIRGYRWEKQLQEDFPKLPVSEFLGRHLPTLIAMGQAVAFAHFCGIVHRDLKPSQVMKGEFGEVLLTDWGLALVHDERIHQETTGLSEMHHLPTIRNGSSPSGTVAYMAPEQTLRDARDIGPWTDVYLLGGTLYQLLTGKLPHGGGNSKQSFFLAAQGIVPHPKEIAPNREIPDELAAIAMQAMAVKIEDRIQSAAEFVARVQDYLTGATRAREGARLLEEAEERFKTAGEDFHALADVQTRLSKSRELWPGNPALVTLHERLTVAQAKQALRARDLSAAQLHAERLAADYARKPLMEQIADARRREEQHASQRRLLIVGFLGLVIVLITGLALFTHDTRVKNAELDEERAIALKAQHTAEEALLSAQENHRVATVRSNETADLMVFMLDEMRQSLDLNLERDRAIRDRLADRIRASHSIADSGLKTEDAALLEAGLLGRIGGSFSDLDLQEDAEHYFTEAMELLERMGLEQHSESASFWFHRGELRKRQGRYREAQEDLRRAVSLDRGAPGGPGETYPLALNDLVSVLWSSNQQEEAMALLPELAEAAKEINDPAKRAMMLSDQAFILFGHGMAQEAEDILLQCRDLLAPKHSNSPEMATILGNLGHLLGATGRVEEAEQLLREVVALSIRLEGPLGTGVATNKNNLALILEQTGREAEAVELYRDAVRIDSQVYGEDHPIVAMRMGNLAHSLMEDGKLEEAESFFRMALAAYGARELEDTPVAVSCLVSFCVLMHRMERGAEVLPQYDLAVERMEKLHGPEDERVQRLRVLRDEVLQGLPQEVSPPG